MRTKRGCIQGQGKKKQRREKIFLGLTLHFVVVEQRTVWCEPAKEGTGRFGVLGTSGSITTHGTKNCYAVFEIVLRHDLFIEKGTSDRVTTHRITVWRSSNIQGKKLVYFYIQFFCWNILSRIDNHIQPFLLNIYYFMV